MYEWTKNVFYHLDKYAGMARMKLIFRPEFRSGTPLPTSHNVLPRVISIVFTRRCKSLPTLRGRRFTNNDNINNNGRQNPSIKT